MKWLITKKNICYYVLNMAFIHWLENKIYLQLFVIRFDVDFIVYLIIYKKSSGE